jgi:xanthine dehydrogenase accessory factor
LVRQDLSEHSTRLRAGRVPFVHARVILAEAPTSAKPGDEAIVTADGTLIGFVGGTCAEATVRGQALALLAGDDPRGTLVLRISPTADTDAGQPGKEVVHNPCLSGGAIELFLEAEVPPVMVAVAGHAPIAAALTALAVQAGFAARPYGSADDLPGDAAAVVVASHGIGEEELLAAALRAGVPYVGLVASRRRGRAVVDSLPVGDELKARVRTPVGLDIGARTPEEVALSILAEIVASRPRPPQRPRPGSYEPSKGQEPLHATDPVCGMSVLTGPEALHLRDDDGADVWFCGPGCRDAFAADPASYRRG